MLTVFVLLAISAFVVTILNAIGRCPLWPAVWLRASSCCGRYRWGGEGLGGTRLIRSLGLRWSNGQQEWWHGIRDRASRLLLLQERQAGTIFQSVFGPRLLSGVR